MALHSHQRVSVTGTLAQPPSRKDAAPSRVDQAMRTRHLTLLLAAAAAVATLAAVALTSGEPAPSTAASTVDRCFADWQDVRSRGAADGWFAPAETAALEALCAEAAAGVAPDRTALVATLEALAFETSLANLLATLERCVDRCYLDPAVAAEFLEIERAVAPGIPDVFFDPSSGPPPTLTDFTADAD